MIETNLEYKAKMQDNSIELLKSIKILIHEPERSKHPFVSITEVLKHIVNMKQKYNNILLEYSKHLKQAKDILEVQVGKDILGHCIENFKELKSSTGA